MLDEFARYTALQRDQMPLAMLLVYLKRKGFVQLNQIWRSWGPPAGTILNRPPSSISWTSWRGWGSGHGEENPPLSPCRG